MKASRNLLNVSIALAIAISWVLPSAAQEPAKPNIVIVLADDLGWGDAGCNNPESLIPTPNIDSLARQGMRFTDAHTPSSVCTPTRYGLLTGRYCWRTRLTKGVLGGFSPHLMDPNRLNIASMLKTHGYRTACVGKWHLGLDWITTDGEKPEPNGSNVDFSKPFANGPLDQGFDFYFGISASNNMPPYCFLRNDRAERLPSLPKAPVYDAQNPEAGMSPGWRDEETGIRFTEEAIAFMKRHRTGHPDKPFFLYLASEAPHRPCVPGPDFKSKSHAGLRGDMVLELDWTVGQVVNTLERLSIRDETLVLVTSDNGGRNGDPLFIYGEESPVGMPPANGGPVVSGQYTYGHKSNGHWRGQKADAWEAGHRVLCVFSWPGRIPDGTVYEHPFCLTDIMATIASLTGHELPRDSAQDSINHLPVLVGNRAESVRDHLVHHSLNGMFAVRRGAWKLIGGKGSGGFTKGAEGSEPGQLYNIRQDPSEQENQWDKQPAIVRDLQALLHRVRETNNTRLLETENIDRR